ncbi:Kdo hydroxylase family protein [bacterium]|nr:Kdo hydroxylase family protein [bacterium]
MTSPIQSEADPDARQPATAAVNGAADARAAGAAPVLPLAEGVDFAAPEVRREALEVLENGGVLLLPKAFSLDAAERELIADLGNFLVREPETGNGRPTIIFQPTRRRMARFNFAFAGKRLVRAEIKPAARDAIERMMARYSDWAGSLLAALAPAYSAALDVDRVTYRPNQRQAVQPLHVDSAYGYPTQGRAMLRIFCNIDPLQRPRVWHVGEPFEAFARRFLPAAQPRRSGWTAGLFARLGIVGGARTPYDLLLAELRRLGKRSDEYQRTAPRRVVEFQPGACWIALTDLVLHGAISGQHSLDQTFFVPPTAMRDPSRSSLRILERLSGRPLV